MPFGKPKPGPGPGSGPNFNANSKLSRPLKVAHRGWHQSHIENTLDAFRAAFEAGCDMVEFDVQLSKDGIPFIFHDENCLRLCKKDVWFYDLNSEDIHLLKMDGKGGEDGKVGEGRLYSIPSLADFLQEFGHHAFYLELKIPKAKEMDAAYFQKLGNLSAQAVTAAGAHPQTFLGSFHTGVLRYLAKAKRFPSLAGIFEDYSRFQDVHGGHDLETAQAIQYYSISWPLYLQFLKDYSEIAPSLLTQNILIWDIAGPDDFIRAGKDGAAGLVTDDIATLLKLNFNSNLE